MYKVITALILMMLLAIPAYASMDDRSDRLSNEQSNIFSPGYINAAKQHADAIINQMNPNKSLFERAMDRVRDMLSNKVNEANVDMPKLELRHKAGGGGDASTHGNNTSTEKAMAASGPVELGQAGAILINKIKMAGSSNSYATYVATSDGGTMKAWSEVQSAGSGFDYANKYYYSITDAQGKIVTGKQQFTGSGDATFYIPGTSYSDWSTKYNEFYNTAYNEAYGIFYNDLIGGYYPYGAPNEGSRQYAQTYAAQYAADYAGIYGSSMSNLYFNMAGSGGAYGSYDISKLEYSKETGLNFTIDKISTQPNADIALSSFKNTFESAFWYNGSQGFYPAYYNEYNSLYNSYYSAFYNAKYDELAGYGMKYSGSGTSYSPNYSSEARSYAAMQAAKMATSQAMAYAVMQGSGAAYYSVNANTQNIINSAQSYARYNPTVLSDNIKVTARDKFYTTTYNNPPMSNHTNAYPAATDIKLNLDGDGLTFTINNTNAVSGSSATVILKGLMENKGVLMADREDAPGGEAMAKAVDNVVLRAVMSIPVESMDHARGGETEFAMTLANIMKNPTEDQKLALDAVQALIAETKDIQGESGSPELSKASDDLLQMVAAVLIAQAMPDLFKETDALSIRSIFQDLNMSKEKMMLKYQKSTKLYYDEMVLELSKNMASLQLRNILKGNISKEELEKLPRNDIDKIITKLRNATDRTDTERSLLQAEAKYRKECLDPNKKMLQDNLKKMMNDFTKRISGVLEEKASREK